MTESGQKPRKQVDSRVRRSIRRQLRTQTVYSCDFRASESWSSGSVDADPIPFVDRTSTMTIRPDHTALAELLDPKP